MSHCSHRHYLNCFFRESGLVRNPEVAVFSFNEVYFIVVLTVVAPWIH